MSNELENFRKSLDEDSGLQSKRRILVMVCLVFLALNLSGATLEEANTFIFKITFTNHVGLNYFFIASIFFMTIRYYSYAQGYHNRLYKFWTQRLLDDPKVFHYNYQEEEVSGLLGKAVDVLGYDEPGIGEPSYCYTGFFKRSLSYRSEGEDERRGPYYYTKYIVLNKFTETWQLKDYIYLIWVELKYQIESMLRYRESLDLFTPYFLSVSAMVSFVFKSELLIWLTTT